MKIGIYIDSLGQSVAKENAISYATRIVKELNYHHDKVTFDYTIEKISYNGNKTSNRITIFKKEGKLETVVYKVYEFKYGEELTQEYEKKNILYKNYQLFSIVFKKFPVLIKRLFLPTKGYNFRFQTFYIFSLFLIIASAILFMIPSTIALLSNFNVPDDVKTFITERPTLLGYAQKLKTFASVFKPEYFVSLITLILLVIPKANVIIAKLAAEFVSAHLYLQLGHKKQDVHGYIDSLIEFICENEEEPGIHFHTYSFGTLLAIDYLFPYGTTFSGNPAKRTEGLITIGCPYDFINSYYDKHYSERDTSTFESKKFHWINVYSIADALASNFRNDSLKGEPDYGIAKSNIKPININYEVANLDPTSFFNFVLLNNLKIHGMYWSNNTDGKSCLNPIYLKMVELGMIG